MSLTKHTIVITSFLSVEKLCCGVTNIFHWIKNNHFQKPLGNFLHEEMRNGWPMNICSSVQLVQSVFLFRMTRMWMEWLIFFPKRLFFPFSIEMWTLRWRWSYCWLLRAAVSNELSLHVRKERWCTVPRWQEGILCSAFFQGKQGGWYADIIDRARPKQWTHWAQELGSLISYVQYHDSLDWFGQKCWSSQ